MNSRCSTFLSLAIGTYIWTYIYDCNVFWVVEYIVDSIGISRANVTGKRLQLFPFMIRLFGVTFISSQGKHTFTLYEKVLYQIMT